MKSEHCVTSPWNRDEKSKGFIPLLPFACDATSGGTYGGTGGDESMFLDPGGTFGLDDSPKMDKTIPPKMDKTIPQYH